MITLLQCIKCARWPTDYPLSILPGIDTDISSYEKQKPQPPKVLQDLSAMNEPTYQRLLKDLHLPSVQIQRFQKAALLLPNLKIDVQNITALSLTVILSRLNPLKEKEARIYAPRFPKPQTEGWFVIVCKEEKDEIVAIKRVGWSSGQGNGKSFGNPNRLSAKAVIKFPDMEDVLEGLGRRLDVLVVSDGYLGMVYKVKGVEVPEVPKVDLAGEGSKGK